MTEQDLRAMLGNMGLKAAALQLLATRNLLSLDALNRVQTEELVVIGLRAEWAIVIKRRFKSPSTSTDQVWAAEAYCSSVYFSQPAPVNAPSGPGDRERRLGMFLGARAPYTGPVDRGVFYEWLMKHYKLDEMKLAVGWMEENLYIPGGGGTLEWDRLDGTSKDTKYTKMCSHLQNYGSLAEAMVLFGRPLEMAGDWAAQLAVSQPGELEEMYRALGEEFDTVRKQPPVEQARVLIGRMQALRELELIVDWRCRRNMEGSTPDAHRIWLHSA